jgi:glycerol-3-phosphate dehydrogenase
LSRAHIIHESDEGIIHMLGGKWTTYRLMGLEAIDYLLKDKILQFGNSNTSSLRLFGFKNVVDFQDPLHVYGTELKRLKTFGAMVSISNHIFISEAMIAYAIQEEMAINLEDILARRTRCLFIDAKETIKIAPKVAQIMASELKMDDTWTVKQLDLFLPLASKYIV